MLIDRVMPSFDVSERHAVVVAAPAGDAFAAVRRLDLARSPTIRALFALRGIPRVLRGERSRSPSLTLDDLVRTGFAPLGEEPGEEIVLGLIGRFWTPRGGIVRVDREEFAAFDLPGFAKAAWNFRVEPRGDREAHLVTETRVACIDERARTRFLLYWSLVGPASGLVRRRALALVKAEAEGGAGRGGGPRGHG